MSLSRRRKPNISQRNLIGGIYAWYDVIKPSSSQRWWSTKANIKVKFDRLMSFDWHLERISWSFHKFTTHSTALERSWWRRFWSERTSGRSDPTNKRNQEETSRHKNFIGFQKDCGQNDFRFRKNRNCFSNFLFIRRSVPSKRLVRSRCIPFDDLFTHCMAWKTDCSRAHSAAIRWYFQTWQKFAALKTYWAALSRCRKKIDHWIWSRRNLQYR